MNKLTTYLPQDRRWALAQGKTLPDRAHGSVLFADISGFTPFTELLRHVYGSRRGAEELTKQLDRVYTPLIAEVERYGGSVIGFAGDSMTCWFDGAGQLASPRAVACAVALQTAMQGLGEIALPNGVVVQLTVKIGVATGEVRRLVVGDGAHYWLDVLAGETVNHTAVAEQLATAPEILLDTATIHALGKTITLSDWRTHAETAQRFGVLAHFTAPLPPSPAPPLPELDEETTRPWLHPLVYEQEKTGHPLLQTDFRPCVALFVRFVGIDYEADTAADQLNQFICPLQAILAHYAGTLIDLTLGDKGSYVYLNFGALSIHEDDARRAAKTALKLRELVQTLPFLAPLQMGITSGVMRTGTYGGKTRRHYGALADEVNVAARLMSTAVGDQILVSEAIYNQLSQQFLFGAEQTRQLKGKRDHITVYPLLNERIAPAIYLPEPIYTTPLIGRQAEQALIAEKLQLAQQGQAQIVALIGEAGLGKSRLTLQAVQIATAQGFVSYGGACQADGLNTPYLVWKQIVTNLFGLTPHHSPQQQIAQLQTQLRRYLPDRVEALPFLCRLLGLPLPENNWIEQLEPKSRRTALHALLEAYLQRVSQETPLLLVVEDLHWVDALSHDFLVELAQVLTHSPILLLLAYRPNPLLPRLQAARLEARPNYTPLPLQALSEGETRALIEHKLNQLYPHQAHEVAPTLVQALLARAEGNPFYLEELLNFFHGRGIDPRTTHWEINVPDNLHSLILSRLDQLSPSQQRIIRVASIIGRRFPLSWLVGYYPNLGDLSQIKTDLAVLHDLDLALLDNNEPEHIYLFKHIITHEVAYESLPYATRARLHEQLAAYLEEIAAPIDSIAYHYGQSDNQPKKQHFWTMAAALAQANFANEVALDYYERLLPLLTSDPDRAEIYFQQGKVLERIGRLEEATTAYQTGLALITPTAVATEIGHYQRALGKVARIHGRYPEALHWFDLAQESLQGSPDLAEVLTERSITLFLSGKPELAETHLRESLVVAREMGNEQAETSMLYSLGNFALLGSDYDTARQYYEVVLSRWRAENNQWGLAGLANGLASVAREQGDLSTARTLYQESLSLKRMMGDKMGLANTLINLGSLHYQTGDYDTAYEVYTEVFQLRREMGNPIEILKTLINIALVSYDAGRVAEARVWHEEAFAMAQQIGNKEQMAFALFGFARMGLGEIVEIVGQDDHEALDRIAAWLCESCHIWQKSKNRRSMTATFVGLARVAVWRGDARRGARLLGAEGAALEQWNAVRQPMVQRLYEETITAVRQSLSPVEFEAAWVEGEKMSLEQAIYYALEETSNHD